MIRKQKFGYPTLFENVLENFGPKFEEPPFHDHTLVGNFLNLKPSTKVNLKSIQVDIQICVKLFLIFAKFKTNFRSKINFWILSQIAC